ncbi:MAG: sigma-70 family RNA polymerase sigma factor [Pseudomonadota bacterium]
MTTGIPETLARARQDFDDLVGAMRPRLHRYCAGMTGSLVDGEDVVQEAMAKAFYALSRTEVSNLEGWLLRIAHNTALDHLRAKQRRDAWITEDDIDLLIDEVVDTDAQEMATAALGTLMQLPPRQRSCVLLKDVLGHSIVEVGALIEAGPAAVKASLHRGRQHLRKLANAPTDEPAALAEPEKSLLTAYVRHFNARDFDAIRAMLAEEVRLDIAGGRGRGQGKREVGGYFDRYSAKHDWFFEPGTIEGRPAAIAYDPEQRSGPPLYFVLLAWDEGRLTEIRDFRYARYATKWAWAG